MIKKLLLAAAMLSSTSAYAGPKEWWEATSDHFIVYSESDQQTAKQVATELERLDQAMRMFRGLPIDGQGVPENAKPKVYNFGTTGDIGRLAGQRGVAGFFIPRAGNSVAFVPVESDDRLRRGSLGVREKNRYELTPTTVLFHEYAHYFMFQHAPAAYPFWYIEGFAELFGTLELTDNGFNLGEPAKHRAPVIAGLGFDIEKVLDPDFDNLDGLMIQRQYAYGWLLTSYLTFEPSRQGQLARYLALVNSGTANLDAARQAFGDLKKLQKELDKYRLGRVRALSVTFPASSTPSVQLRRLNEDEAAQMKLHIESTAGVTEREAKGLVPEARALVANYPNSPAVLSSAIEAEFDAKNFTEARALANHLIAIDPQSVRAHLYLANIALQEAKSDPAKIAEARSEFVAANRIDPENPAALQGYYLTYVYANETPPEPALLAIEASYRMAPFDAGIRQNLAHLLLTENRDKEALVILGPVVNAPHETERGKEFRELVEKLEAGNRQPLIDELRPSLDDDEEEEED